MSSGEVDRELERLREQYREKLDRELASLAELLDRAARAGHGRPELEEIQRRAHRLMGTSGSYGLAASSAALGRIEAEIGRLLATPDDDIHAAWRAIQSELAAARAAVSS